MKREYVFFFCNGQPIRVKGLAVLQSLTVVKGCLESFATEASQNSEMPSQHFPRGGLLPYQQLQQNPDPP